MPTSVNIKNPAIKRIHADVRELMKDPSDQYHAAPLETNLFEWHFTLRGPPETAFEGGVYHGRILLPPEYPFRPPDIVFNTPNGRFTVGSKVCLTISSFHPEYWQPAWGIRLILEALISFFPSPSHGALGGLDYPDTERKRLAIESNEWKCYKCGHAKALLPELKPKSRTAGEGAGGGGGGSNRYSDQIKQLHKLKVKTAAEVASESKTVADAGAASADPAPVGVGGNSSSSSDVASNGDRSDSGDRNDSVTAAAGSTIAGATGGDGETGTTAAVPGNPVSTAVVEGTTTSKDRDLRGSGEDVDVNSTQPQTTAAIVTSRPGEGDVICANNTHVTASTSLSSPSRHEGGVVGVSTAQTEADGDDAVTARGGGGGPVEVDEGRLAEAVSETREEHESEEAKRSREKEDDMLTYLAVAIAVAIAAILLRKFLRHVGM